VENARMVPVRGSDDGKKTMGKTTAAATE